MMTAVMMTASTPTNPPAIDMVGRGGLAEIGVAAVSVEEVAAEGVVKNAPTIDVVGSGPAAMLGVEVAADSSVVVGGSVLLHEYQLDKNTILVKHMISQAI